MNHSQSSPALQRKILKFGQAIFSKMDRSQPSVFSKKYWSARMMEWSMRRPELKTNLFRLVDVLPALRTRKNITGHVAEYLGGYQGPLGGLWSFVVNAPRYSLRALLVATAVRFGVKQMASQFIAGESPATLLPALRHLRQQGKAFTVDLLGEFTLSEVEATKYLERYMEALDVFSMAIPDWQESAPLIAEHPGERSPICISVKLTALYSQCSVLNFSRSVDILTERLSTIARKAKECGALLYVDAEDTANNEIIYATFKNTFSKAEFLDFPSPGIVVQAYARESQRVVEELLQFAKDRGAPISIRLVKGAYWDYETITAALNDWSTPLFSQKQSSDANYEQLSRILLDNINHCLPAFGSHNVRSLAHACCYAESIGVTKERFEIQALYGMADPIAQAFTNSGYLVRLYVPLGDLFVGMGYLVRRLLENTSNESFLKHTFFDAKSLDALLAEPIAGE